MSGLLHDKTAVVTGGASGIGRAMATRFAEEGADVVIADIREQPRLGGTPTDELIHAETCRRAKYVRCDVTKFEDVVNAVEEAETLGGVDIMVNNAGIYRRQEFLGISEEDFEKMVAINQKGVFFGCQAALERMVDAGEGCIVNTASLAGDQGGDRLSTYSMTKGGVRLLTYALAAEFGSHGIRINSIHPGVIRTAMPIEDEPQLDGDEGEEAETQRMALGRIGEPEEVANVALFLASELASYVHGESIIVDGGMGNVGA